MVSILQASVLLENSWCSAAQTLYLFKAVGIQVRRVGRKLLRYSGWHRHWYRPAMQGVESQALVLVFSKEDLLNNICGIPLHSIGLENCWYPSTQYWLGYSAAQYYWLGYSLQLHRIGWGIQLHGIGIGIAQPRPNGCDIAQEGISSAPAFS